MTAHEADPDRPGCTCGWTPPLGASIWRSFDKHLLEVARADG